MAKITNMVGLAKGKTGSIVYSVRNGQQIARAYNPYVSNPNTPAQVQSRAKLKLLSQVSAAVAPVIAIPRQGAVSARNGFTAVNYKYTEYVSRVAQIKLADMQLTDSAVGLEGFTADRTSGTAIHCELLADMSAQFDAIVWVAIAKLSSGQLYPAADALVEIPGIDGKFAVDLPFIEGDVSIHAYGIRTKSAAAKAAFGNLTSRDASGVASLVANRTIPVADLGLSETRGLFMPIGVDQGETTGSVYNYVRVSIVDENGRAVSGAGSLSGAGNYEDGAECTLQFTPAEGVTFVGWRETIDGVTTHNNPWTFNVTQSKELLCVVRMPVQTYPLMLLFANGSTATSAQLVGGGNYPEDTEVQIEAPEVANNDFVGWYEDQAGTELYSSERQATIVTLARETRFYAKYQSHPDDN